MSLWKVNQITESTPGVGVNVTNARFRSGPWFDVTHSDFGAKGDGTTDDTAALQAARAAAVAAGGGVVFFPAATFLTGPIQHATNVRFQGCGPYISTLKLKAAATDDLLIVDNQTQWEVCDLGLDGNAANQTVAYHALRVKNMTTPAAVRPVVRNVFIQKAKGDGLHIDAGQYSAGMFSQITVYFCDGIGIYAGGYDNKWNCIDVGQSGLQGIYINASSTHWTDVKAWFSGRLTPASGTGVEQNTGISKTFMVNVEAQDNQANGFLLRGSDFQGYGLQANSNNQGTLGKPGFYLLGLTNSLVDGSADAVADLSTLQRYAVTFDASTPPTGNVIRLRSSSNVSGIVNGDPTGNDVEILDNAGTRFSHRFPVTTYGSSTDPQVVQVDATDSTIKTNVSTFKGGSGETNYRIDPVTADNLHQGLIALFRNTNASSVELQVYKGDGTATVGWKMNGSGVATFAAGPTFRAGAGSPEGVVTAPIGSLYLRSDGGAGTSHYVKESGAGNTGWVAK